MITFLTNEINLENFFMNISFLVLLFSTILYWTQTIFQFHRNYGKIGMIFANFFLFALLVLRWENSGHFPLSNLYESFIFLSWTLTLINLIVEYSVKIPFFGVITSPSALLTNAFANFCLPSDMQQSSPLVPALQSNWLMMHVTVMILSYAALISGSLLSIGFLILNINSGKKRQKELKENNLVEIIPNIIPVSNSITLKPETNLFTNILGEGLQESNSEIQTSNTNLDVKYKELADLFDNLSYRILGLGFPLLTIGILSGAVWANEAWGSYWSWDPKETWALLTWFVFAIYLHVRLKKGWNGKKPALIASFGFFVVWICYLGVNLMGQGLHSYGWVHS